MASTLNPYLSFAGNARQAMEFYEQVFGGNLTLSTFGEMGAQEQPNGIMHSQLATSKGYTIMASDTPDGQPPQQGNNMTISLSGDDSDELHRYWQKLSAGGNVMMPLEKQAWGDEFGMLTDKFGVPWMVNISSATA